MKRLLLALLLAGALPAPAAAPLPAAQVPAAPARRASARAIAHYLSARRAEGQGDLPQALQEIRLALVFDEGSAQIRSLHAEMLARLDRLPEAEAEARRAVSLEPDGEPAADAWLLLGRIAAHRNDLPAARHTLREARRLELELAAARGPDEDRLPDAEPWRALARAELAGGDENGAAATWADLGRWLPAEAARGYREMARAALEARQPARAERWLRAATDVNPGESEAWRRLAQLAERRKAPAEARAGWEKALRADPEDLEALTALGRLSLKAGDAAAAAAYFRQFRLLDPDEAGAVAGVASAYLEARRPDEALAYLDAWKGAPDPRLPFVRGMALEALRRWADAAEAFGGVGREDPELWKNARLSRVYTLAQAGKNAQALRELDEQAPTRAGDARTAATRAWLLERLGRTEEALAVLRGAVAEREKTGEEEGTGDLYDALAQTLSRAGRNREAVALLQGAVARRPRDESLLYALAVAQGRASDAEAALAQMKALLVLNPEHAEAMNFVGYSYAERGVKLDEAERLLLRALEIRPDNGFFLDSLGWVYFQKGDLARAISTLESADRLAGPEPTILEHLGDAYRRGSRPVDAERTYRRALRSLDAGESQDPPDRARALRHGLEKKVRDLSPREARPAGPAGQVDMR
ncbi:MAG: tetratricopeptide repeat protein [Deltaproteobacteria bacterium]|nr:tetratricopeptide repeat protein [Deltaproteobacteria bacterium]